MDNLDNKKWQENSAFFLCEYCDYKTSRKSHYDKHLLTPKHKRIILDNEKFPDNNLSYECLCGKDNNMNQLFILIFLEGESNNLHPIIHLNHPSYLLSPCFPLSKWSYPDCI